MLAFQDERQRCNEVTAKGVYETNLWTTTNTSRTRCFDARSIAAEHVRRGLGVVEPALERREVVTRFEPRALSVGQLDASALQLPQQRAARAVELALAYAAVDEGLREGGNLYGFPWTLCSMIIASMACFRASRT